MRNSRLSVVLLGLRAACSPHISPVESAYFSDLYFLYTFVSIWNTGFQNPRGSETPTSSSSTCVILKCVKCMRKISYPEVCMCIITLCSSILNVIISFSWVNEEDSLFSCYNFNHFYNPLLNFLKINTEIFYF